MNDEITLAEIVRRAREVGGIVRQRWRVVAVCAAVALVPGGLVAFGGEAEFTARTQLVPFRRAAVGGAEGLAGLAGIRLPSSGGGDVTISADLYPQVVKTLDFRVAVAETPIAFAGDDSLRTPAWYFRERYRPPFVEVVKSYTIGMPGRILVALSPAEQLPLPRRGGGDSTRRTPRFVEPAYRGLVNSVGDRVRVTFEANGGIIEISARMPDPVAAADLVRAAADRLTETVISYEAKKADEQVRFVGEQQALAKDRYDATERELSTFVSRNRALGPVAEIERARLEREANMTFELLLQASRELEQARFARNQDAPVFLTLEEATVPTSRSGPSPVITTLVALVLGAIAGIGVVLGRAVFSRFTT